MQLLISLLLVFTVSFSTVDIAGKWRAPKENTVIDINKVGNVYEGIVLQSDNKKAVGQKVLRDLKKEGNKWKGKLYAIEKDELVDVELELKDEMLEVTLKKGWMSKTVEWKRVK